MSRIENLLNKINKSNERLSEWEEKRDLSENPNVKANCNIEIKRIKIQIEKYNKELEKLTNINSNSSIQSDFESEKEFKIKFGTFIILFILTPIVYLAIAWLGKGIIKDDTIDFIIHWLFPLPIIVLYFMVMKSEAKIKREKYEFRGKASGAFAAAIIIYLLSFIPRSNNSEPFDLTITIKSNDKEVYDNFNNNTLKVFFDKYKENPNADYNKNTNHFEVEDIPPKYIEDSVSFLLNYEDYYIVDRNNNPVDENKKYLVNEKIILRISRRIDMINNIISKKTMYDKKKDVLKIFMKDLSQKEIDILEKYKNISRKKGNTTEHVIFVKDEESFVLTNSVTNKPISTNIKKLNVGSKENVILPEKTANNVIDNIRSTDLKKKIKNNYERLSEWEEKRDLAENPDEKARCNNKIKYIKKRIKEYKNELANI